MRRRAATFGVVVAFLSERLPTDLIAMSAFALVVSLGIVNEKSALSLFGDDAVITIGAMFVLSGALEKTGALQSLAVWFTRVSQGKELRTLCLLALVVLPISAFVNNPKDSFSDFLKVGVVLQLMLGVVAVVVIPMLWPF